MGRVRQFGGERHQELAQQENEERAPQEDGQNQRVVGVEPVKVAEYQVQGNESHEVRQDHRGQHDGEDVVASGPLDAGKSVRDQCVGQDGSDHRRHGDHHRVPEVASQGTFHEGGHIVVPSNWIRDPDGRIQRQFLGVLQGGRNHPYQRNQEEGGEQGQHQVLANSAEGLHQTAGPDRGRALGAGHVHVAGQWVGSEWPGLSGRDGPALVSGRTLPGVPKPSCRTGCTQLV